MAIGSGAKGEEPITAINVTPLVDIILVVLIIFMVTAPLIARRALPVHLPKAVAHVRVATQALQVVVNAHGVITLSGRRLGLDDLKTELRRALRLESDLHVTLAADKGLAYGRVVRVLDAVRGAGVRKVGLEVVSS